MLTRPGRAEPKPLLGRIVASALLMALFGWVLGQIYDAAAVHRAGHRRVRGRARAAGDNVALGLLVGGARVRARRARPRAGARRRRRHPRLPLSAVLYRGRERVRIMAEEVPAAELGYVVPFEARSKLRRRRLRRAARARCAAGPSGATRPTWASSPRSIRSTARRSTPTRGPAGPRVLRAHQPLQAVDHPGVARWMKPGLRGLQARGGGAARPGHDPLQHRGGPAGDGLHDRHHRPRRRRGDRHPRLDPHLRRHGQADLRRDLHELPSRGAAAT